MTRVTYFETRKLKLNDAYSLKQDLTYFLRGKIQGDTVTILPNQESYQMNSFAIADCIIELNKDNKNFKKGDVVEVLMIG